MKLGKSGIPDNLHTTSYYTLGKGHTLFKMTASEHCKCCQSPYIVRFSDPDGLELRRTITATVSINTNYIAFLEIPYLLLTVGGLHKSHPDPAIREYFKQTFCKVSLKRCDDRKTQIHVQPQNAHAIRTCISL